MRRFKYTIIGFFGFALSASINVTLGFGVYTLVQDFDNWIIAIVIIGAILTSALLCSIIDYIRRKLTIEKPLKEILDATEMMARGNFKIKLTPNHTYKYYDEYDIIKDDLNNMANELSKSEVLKNDFIANVSHEIKTPLSVIQSYAKALTDEKITQEQRNKYLENLQYSCKKLSNLITNILKLNKLENHNLLPDIKRFNLSELVIEQIVQFEELVDKKNINLNCDIEENLFINSEGSYIQLIVNNLISNAIKFTNYHGNIELTLKKDNEKNFILIVRDDGCGMSKETGQHIFDKFYQGDTSHSKEGNGLGLSLVKKVIDILGGKIEVNSEINVGTTFKVTLKEN